MNAATILRFLTRLLDGYPLQLMISVMVVSAAFPKKKHFWIKLIPLLFLLMVAFDTGCQQIGIIPNPVLDRLVLVVPGVYICGLVVMCYECSLLEAIYLVASSHPAQNIVYNIYWVLKNQIGFEEGSLSALPFSWGLMLIVYGLVYLLFASRLSAWQQNAGIKKKLVINASIVMFFLIFLTRRAPGMVHENSIYMSYIIADILAMMIQFGLFQESEMEHKYAIMENLMLAEQKKQQQIEQSVEIINRKCHDLKHQIAAIREMKAGPEMDEYVSKIEQAVMIYEADVKTGNRALDNILMDKILFAKEHDIKLTCICDAEQLSTLDTMDIYSLFGNILDNAIDSVMQETEKENRIISLRVGCKGAFLCIHEENYIGHTVEMKNGMPVTTKSDKEYHGFGVLSIRHVAEKYGGTMSISLQKELFVLDILIPVTFQG